MAEPILELERVSKSYGGLRAVDEVTLSVPPGSITALIGPNGAGKSTLFNAVTGFGRPDEGEIVFAGRSIFGLPSYRIARLGLVRTFQLTRVFEAVSVLDNMLAATNGHPGERLGNVLFRPRRVVEHERRLHDRARELLTLFSLDDKAGDYAGELSGGQRKLLELARALMLEPRVVLLDEPMAGVNPTLGARLLEYMHRLRDEQGLTFLFVEHDMDVVMRQADRLVVMAQGRVIVEGSPDEVQRDERVIDAYLGPEWIPREADAGGG